MSFAEHARTLIAYNRWANEKLLDAAAGVPADDAGRRLGASFGSVHGNLQHILFGQVIWLARWRGDAAPPPPQHDDGDAHAVHDALAAMFAASHNDLDAFAQSLADADWGRIVAFADTSGVPHADPLGRLITHVVNHGTFHRGETGMLLARFDRSPGDLDYHYYCRGAGR